MGLKNKMMLVQVDDQRMLLSMNTQDIRTLHAWQTVSHQELKTEPDKASLAADSAWSSPHPYESTP